MLHKILAANSSSTAEDGLLWDPSQDELAWNPAEDEEKQQEPDLVTTISDKEAADSSEFQQLEVPAANLVDDAAAQ